ncbi:hypothetical protein HPB49_025060 [Dermacentor silvarum]|uniref:Uncharacterized protein n=1 Tax=Dermacentor silvarum TaxID=543639 RepID=A0ACB8CU42_DERSI|nr:hypothetical protein HPB49_025060 [Dermacentor silvarum]
MNTSSLKSSTTECRKFAPNIFNKSKCQNCFRTKDAHSAEALESNRPQRLLYYGDPPSSKLEVFASGVRNLGRIANFCCGFRTPDNLGRGAREEF